MTLDDLREHCKRTIDPNEKIVFDTTSKIYQEHKMILDLIEEHNNRFEHEAEIRADERIKTIDEFMREVRKHHYLLRDNKINSTDYGMFTCGLEQIASELKEVE